MKYFRWVRTGIKTHKPKLIKKSRVIVLLMSKISGDLSPYNCEIYGKLLLMYKGRCR